jgi:hypothetical protein
VATGVATRHPDLRIAEVPAHIGQPAWRASLQLQPGLVRTILADVGNQPGSCPLLEHMLLEVWQRRQARTLTLEGCVASGGVQGALAQRAAT